MIQTLCKIKISHRDNWRLADYTAIEAYLAQIDWYSLVSNYPSAPALWDAFMATLSAGVSQFVPRINTIGGSKHKDFTKAPREIRKCLSRKRLLWKKLKQNRFNTVVRAKYRECCFKHKSLIQQHELHIEESIINANQIGSFYRFINRRIYNRSDVGVLVEC